MPDSLQSPPPLFFTRARLPIGTKLAERFVLDAPIGEGGMAVVYRGRDLLSEAGAQQVAVKLLHADTQSDFILEHFLREAEILAGLRHPHIVSYVAHGRTASGEAYLAMEWIAGETLEQRLRRGPLRLSEVVQLFTLLASALATLHRRGIVHRDIKPSNLILRNNQIQQVTLLDFGVARRLSATAPLTRTGVIVGTPEYMAPEQVRGERSVGPPADIFALGCVLHECLCAKPPFCGEELVAVLAKILFEEAPDIRQLRPGIPEELASLLVRMLGKDPEQRIRDGMGLFDALSRLPAFAEDIAVSLKTELPQAAARPSGLRGDVQELLSVVVANAPQVAGAFAETVEALPAEQLPFNRNELLKGLSALHGQAAFLLDGSLVAVFRHFSTATDQAMQAARAALLVGKHWPGARLAVTTGRGLQRSELQRSELPMGEAVERAARMLSKDTAADTPASTAHEVLLDEVTADLIAFHFETYKKSSRVFLLRDAQQSLDALRPLLGKPTPCVGRERELLALENILAATIDEPLAQAVIITSPAGGGKSRLRHEFLRRVFAKGTQALMLSARGAPLSAGTAFGLLGQALRGLVPESECQSAEQWRQRFDSRIAQHLPKQRAGRILPFLAEMSQLGASEDNELLRAARLDPQLMHEQMSRAFIEFLNAECGAQPVIFVLEDLHWGDPPTVRLLDIALRDLTTQPLLIVALCRPEAHDQFPSLWQKRHRHEIPLWGLPRQACARLVREVLGASVTAELEGRIINQAAGNALFLEELIRAAAEGKSDSVPETVLAMFQARLSRLPAGARAAICAASIYGSVFWQGGITALLDKDQGPAVATWLPQLVSLEMIQAHSSTRLRGELEFEFRHDLLRDAAYSLLREEDRTLGHRLAGQYLEAAGEREALALAEHYIRGDAARQAARWYHCAAEQALESNELLAAHERAQKALDAGAEGIDRGKLFGLRAAAAYWQRDDQSTRRYAQQALELLLPGTADYYHSAAHLMVSSGQGKDWEQVSRWQRAVLAAEVKEDARPALALCLARTGFMFMLQGRHAEMLQIAEQLALQAKDIPESEPGAWAQVHHFRSGYAAISGDPVTAIRELEATLACFERAGDKRNALLERSNLACNYTELGLFEEGAQICRQNLSECEAAKARPARTLTLVILGYTLTFFPDKWMEAEPLLEQALGESAAQNSLRHQGWAAAARARLLFLTGRYGEAEAQAQEALSLLKSMPSFHAWPLGWLARALVKQGRPKEALAAAEQGLHNLKAFGGYTMDLWVPQLGYIEALEAHGRKEAAAQAAKSARRRVLRHAERIGEPTWRGQFLKHPQVTEILARAEVD